MKNQRNTLLAGIAALALIAGTGLASAQEQSKEHGATQAKEPQTSTQPMKKSEPGTTGSQSQLNGKMGPQGTQPDKMGQSTQRTEPSKMGESQGGTQGKEQNAKSKERIGPSTAQQGAEQKQRAQETNRSSKADKTRENRAAQGEQRKEGATAQSERNKAGASTAQDERLKGLQGNASGAHVNLTEEQRTHIRDTIIESRGAPRVGRVDFDVAVGTVIPRGRIHVVPVPETLVQIEPEWRGFLYFVYEDEVVIVNPRDMRIVAVLVV